MYDFLFVVVEVLGILYLMIIFWIRVEVLIVVIVEYVDVVDGVGRRVRVY